MPARQGLLQICQRLHVDYHYLSSSDMSYSDQVARLQECEWPHTRLYLLGTRVPMPSSDTGECRAMLILVLDYPLTTTVREGVKSREPRHSTFAVTVRSGSACVAFIDKTFML